jgi:hypothetical protein
VQTVIATRLQIVVQAEHGVEEMSRGGIEHTPPLSAASGEEAAGRAAAAIGLG